MSARRPVWLTPEDRHLIASALREMKSTLAMRARVRAEDLACQVTRPAARPWETVDHLGRAVRMELLTCGPEVGEVAAPVLYRAVPVESEAT